MQNVDPSMYYPYNTQYPAQSYSGTASSGTKTRRRLGATMLGCLAGMTAYFIPVNKDVFVNRAFEESKKEVQTDISQLKKAEQELRKGSLSRESEGYLAKRNVNGAVNDVVNELRTQEDRITMPDSVKSIKEELANNFNNLKKEARLRSNPESKAFQAIKWNNFAWGVGICAAVG
ncbi:MAG: hypothetical protein LBJ74_06005, partial [Heliobacteriaceae bacterium]|nr:hypothetical protein [Heliobacteriaceae bacterium]